MLMIDDCSVFHSGARYYQPQILNNQNESIDVSLSIAISYGVEIVSLTKCPNMEKCKLCFFFPEMPPGILTGKLGTVHEPRIRLFGREG